jgi:glycosyltransferase involved in cell wall biosynthesis
MEGMKHILHVSTPISWRGGEQQLYYLVQGSKNYRHTVLCPENSVLAERLRKLGGVELLHFDNASFFTRWVSVQRALTWSQFSFDMLHTHDAKAHSLALYALMITGKKTPIIVHRRVDFAIKKNAIKSFKYTHHLVGKVISVSKAIDAMVAEHLPEHKRAVVYSGVEIEAVYPPSKNIRFELGFDQNTFVVTNVAALAPHKDQKTLLKAFSLFLKKVKGNANIQLLIAGEGKSRSSVEDAIEELDLKKHVTLLGYRDDVKKWLASSDVFAISSETEGLGTSIIDAMAAKLPIVATAAGGIVELVKPDETGLLVAVKDIEAFAKALETMYNDKQLRQTLSEGAFQRANDFSQIKMVEGIETVYRDVSSSFDGTANKKA